jgi:lysophospholipid acyltransferase (LPLAT)-like uncharacterized protein
MGTLRRGGSLVTVPENPRGLESRTTAGVLFIAGEEHELVVARIR